MSHDCGRRGAEIQKATDEAVWKPRNIDMSPSYCVRSSGKDLCGMCFAGQLLWHNKWGAACMICCPLRPDRKEHSQISDHSGRRLLLTDQPPSSWGVHGLSQDSCPVEVIDPHGPNSLCCLLPKYVELSWVWWDPCCILGQWWGKANWKEGADKNKLARKHDRRGKRQKSLVFAILKGREQQCECVGH